MPSPFIVAAFDFDGTLTYRDSFMPFLRHTYGLGRFIRGSACESLWIAAWLARIINNEQCKGHMIARFLSGVPEVDVSAAAARFAQARLPDMLRPDMLIRLQAHHAAGHCCVLVSASPRLVLAPWAAQNGISAVIGTELEAEHGVLTGRYAGRNCWGEEKVRRLEAWLLGRKPDMLYAYGDTHGDFPLLRRADHAVYRGRDWAG